MLYKGYRQQYSYRNNITSLPNLARAGIKINPSPIKNSGSTDMQNTSISIREKSQGPKKRRVHQSENDYNPFAPQISGARELRVGEQTQQSCQSNLQVNTDIGSSFFKESSDKNEKMFNDTIGSNDYMDKYKQLRQERYNLNGPHGVVSYTNHERYKNVMGLTQSTNRFREMQMQAHQTSPPESDSMQISKLLATGQTPNTTLTTHQDSSKLYGIEEMANQANVNSHTDRLLEEFKL